eukprot:scaffold184562_cov31-Tisochrysis_lutea.AAC.1
MARVPVPAAHQGAHVASVLVECVQRLERGRACPSDLRAEKDKRFMAKPHRFGRSVLRHQVEEVQGRLSMTITQVSGAFHLEDKLTVVERERDVDDLSEVVHGVGPVRNQFK